MLLDGLNVSAHLDHHLQTLQLLLHFLNHGLRLRQLHLHLRRDVGFLVNLRQRVHGSQAVGDDIGAREIHVAEDQVTRSLEQFLIRAQQRQHGFHSLHPLALVARPGVHHHVELAHGDIVEHLIGAHHVGNALVDRHQIRLAVRADDPHHALLAVHVGHQIQNDLARVPDAARQVVIEMEVRHVDLLLLTGQRLP